jgi:hypothetical protein
VTGVTSRRPVDPGTVKEFKSQASIKACSKFLLIEPDRQISRIRLSEKTHDGSCDAASNF